MLAISLPIDSVAILSSRVFIAAAMSFPLLFCISFSGDCVLPQKGTEISVPLRNITILFIVYLHCVCQEEELHQIIFHHIQHSLPVRIERDAFGA